MTQLYEDRTKGLQILFLFNEYLYGTILTSYFLSVWKVDVCLQSKYCGHHVIKPYTEQVVVMKLNIKHHTKQHYLKESTLIQKVNNFQIYKSKFTHTIIIAYILNLPKMR